MMAELEKVKQIRSRQIQEDTKPKNPIENNTYRLRYDKHYAPLPLRYHIYPDILPVDSVQIASAVL